MLKALFATTLVAFFPASTPKQPLPTCWPPLAFEALHFNLEYSDADQDAEMVLKLDAGVGLKRLVVLDPCGHQMMRFAERDLGSKKITLETPEPSLAAVTQAYPAGTYQFLGLSVENQFVYGTVTLSHQLPAPAVIANPQNGAVNVPRTGVVASWAASAGATSYRIELDQDALGLVLNADIPVGVTSFAIPDNWIQPGEECELSIAAVRADGNLIVSQVVFTAAP